jgi:hypothetical protein
MALSDDQRAMLRLLAERGEGGYEDIAALKGVGVDQVRAEMREALAAAAAEQEPAGPAQPKPSEPPVEAPKPADPEPAPPPPQPSPSTAAKPAPVPRKPRRGASPPPERRRFAMIAAAALVLVAVVIAMIALIGGTSGGSSSSEATSSASAEGGASNQLTQAELQPVSGQSGEGRAIFGRVGKEEIVLQVAAQGLDSNEAGQSYTVWLYRSPKIALRVGSAKVTKSGRLGVQLPIPAELLAYVVSGAFDQIYLSRTSDAAYEREVAQAKKQKKLPPYSGETVLAGEITGPIVKPAGGESH